MWHDGKTLPQVQENKNCQLLFQFKQTLNTQQRDPHRDRKFRQFVTNLGPNDFPLDFTSLSYYTIPYSHFCTYRGLQPRSYLQNCIIFMTLVIWFWYPFHILGNPGLGHCPYRHLRKMLLVSQLHHNSKPQTRRVSSHKKVADLLEMYEVVMAIL